MRKPALLLFTSLYPYPWQPSRAMFNFQQYQSLSAYYDIKYLVPVPWLTWLRNFFSLFRQQQYPHVCYFPMFYIPGLFRSLNAAFLLVSVVLCIVPLLQLIKARRVLASWAFPDALVPALLKPVCRYKLVIQCLGSDVNVHQDFAWRRWMLAKAFACANAVVTVSQDLANKVRAINPAARVVTIYNGVNFERFTLPLTKPATKQLIFIGNLIRTKGVYELLSALALIKAPNIKLHVVGDGPERLGLQQKVDKLGLQSQIIFHGRLPHAAVATLLQHSKCLVLPTYQEGVPNVIMEAFACGIPVVATAVGGIPEVVTEQSGILLADYQPETIAEGIRLALQHNWDGNIIRQSIGHFTWQANSNQLFTLIEHGIEPFLRQQQKSLAND